MTRLVVDAGIVATLFFEETYSAAAAARIKSAKELLAPDLMWIESANVVWKRCQRNEITADRALGIVTEMMRLPVDTHASRDLVPHAAALAVTYKRTVYDCVYLALAIRENCPFLTADRRLVRSLSHTTLAQRLRFVGD